MNPTPSYCAARFLDNWVRKESSHHENMQAPSAETVRSALAYFKVSRGFSRIADRKVGEHVAKLLINHDKYVTLKTAPTRVVELAEAMKNRFAQKNLLSAASKLLWLRTRTPFIIYDSRAVSALLLKHDFEKRDYPSYCQAWRVEYDSHKKKITTALEQLSDFTEFTAAASLGKAYVSKVASEEWFAERVFDQYLWLIGAPKDAERSGEADDA